MGSRWVRNRPQGRMNPGGGVALAWRGDRCFRGKASVFLINPGIAPRGDSRRICRPTDCITGGPGATCPGIAARGGVARNPARAENVTVARLKWSHARLSRWRDADPRRALGSGPRPVAAAGAATGRALAGDAACRTGHPFRRYFGHTPCPRQGAPIPLVTPFVLRCPPSSSVSRAGARTAGRRPGRPRPRIRVTTSRDPPESPPGMARCRTYCEWCRRAGRPPGPCVDAPGRGPIRGPVRRKRVPASRPVAGH